MSRLLILSLFLIFVSCTTTRKISSVGLRDISSLPGADAVSERRQRTFQAVQYAKECPQEVVDEFRFIAMERIEYPVCPEALARTFPVVAHYLKTDERNSIEEAMNTQCRSLGSVTDGTALDLIFPEAELSNLSSRATGSPDPSLNEFRSVVQEMIDRHLLIDRWGRQNGEFILPEELLSHLNLIILDHKCRLSDDEVDQSYRSIRVLEDLVKILPEGKQREHVERLLKGIYVIQDRKIEEFFKR